MTQSIFKLIILVVKTKVYIVIQSYCTAFTEFHQEAPSGNLHFIFQTIECKHDEITLASTDHCISISSIEGEKNA